MFLEAWRLQVYNQGVARHWLPLKGLAKSLSCALCLAFDSLMKIFGFPLFLTYHLHLCLQFIQNSPCKSMSLSYKATIMLD